MGKRSVIHIENCQIKSLEKLQIVAKCIDTLEKEIGIHSVKISFKDMFLCPDIDLTVPANSKDACEKLIGELCIKLDKLKYGKESVYSLKK